MITDGSLNVSHKTQNNLLLFLAGYDFFIDNPPQFYIKEGYDSDGFLKIVKKHVPYAFINNTIDSSFFPLFLARHFYHKKLQAELEMSSRYNILSDKIYAYTYYGQDLRKDISCSSIYTDIPLYVITDTLRDMTGEPYDKRKNFTGNFLGLFHMNTIKSYLLVRALTTPLIYQFRNAICECLYTNKNYIDNLKGGTLSIKIIQNTENTNHIIFIRYGDSTNILVPSILSEYFFADIHHAYETYLQTATTAPTLTPTTLPTVTSFGTPSQQVTQSQQHLSVSAIYDILFTNSVSTEVIENTMKQFNTEVSYINDINNMIYYKHKEYPCIICTPVNVEEYRRKICKRIKNSDNPYGHIQFLKEKIEQCLTHENFLYLPYTIITTLTYKSILCNMFDVMALLGFPYVFTAINTGFTNLTEYEDFVMSSFEYNRIHNYEDKKDLTVIQMLPYCLACKFIFDTRTLELSISDTGFFFDKLSLSKGTVAFYKYTNYSALNTMLVISGESIHHNNLLGDQIHEMFDTEEYYRKRIRNYHLTRDYTYTALSYCMRKTPFNKEMRQQVIDMLNNGLSYTYTKDYNILHRVIMTNVDNRKLNLIIYDTKYNTFFYIPELAPARYNDIDTTLKRKHPTDYEKLFLEFLKAHKNGVQFIVQFGNKYYVSLYRDNLTLNAFKKFKQKYPDYCAKHVVFSREHVRTLIQRGYESLKIEDL